MEWQFTKMKRDKDRKMLSLRFENREEAEDMIQNAKAAVQKLNDISTVQKDTVYYVKIMYLLDKLEKRITEHERFGISTVLFDDEMADFSAIALVLISYIFELLVLLNREQELSKKQNELIDNWRDLYTWQEERTYEMAKAYMEPERTRFPSSPGE